MGRDIVYVEWQASIMCALYVLHVKNIQLIYCYTSDTVGLRAYGSWLIICIQVTNWKQDRISLHMTPYPHIIGTPRRDRNHLSYPQHTEPVHVYMWWHEICALLGYYAAYSGSTLPKFRDNLSVTSSRLDGTDRFSQNVDKDLPPHAA
jgi:hypothetical protein